jgi:hypothetical protein
MYAVADDELPAFRQEFDGRLMSQDVGRIEFVHSLEAVRKRVEALEQELAALRRVEAAAEARSNGHHPAGLRNGHS